METEFGAGPALEQAREAEKGGVTIQDFLKQTRYNTWVDVTVQGNELIVKHEGYNSFDRVHENVAKVGQHRIAIKDRWAEHGWKYGFATPQTRYQHYKNGDLARRRHTQDMACRMWHADLCMTT